MCAIQGFGDAQREPGGLHDRASFSRARCVGTRRTFHERRALHEVNEAFAVVALANAQILNVDIDKVNQKGGYRLTRTPVGMSGARIVGSLAMQLEDVGVASICNGGGGASCGRDFPLNPLVVRARP